MNLFSLPNSVTLLRIFLSPVFAYLFFQNDFASTFSALIIFIFAAISDWYDGWIARKLGSTSNFGNFFDPLADKILVSTAFAIFTLKGIMPLYMTVIIIFRDVLITLMRMIFESNSKVLNTLFFAKTKTFLQMVAIYFFLCIEVINLSEYKIFFNSSFPLFFNSTFQFYFLLIVTLITAATGIVYFYSNFAIIKEIFSNYKTKHNISIIEVSIGSIFFCGFFPKLPGTFTSLTSIIFLFFINIENQFISLFFIFILIHIGNKIANKFENSFGNDPQIFTLDEFIGMWISVLFIPFNIYFFALAFLIFRLMDIFKPWPASYFNSKSGGVGILFDDIFAGLYTNLIMQIIIISPLF